MMKISSPPGRGGARILDEEQVEIAAPVETVPNAAARGWRSAMSR